MLSIRYQLRNDEVQDGKVLQENEPQKKCVLLKKAKFAGKSSSLPHKYICGNRAK